MAFEVFDDVAFYWFLQVILGIALLPITIYRIRDFFTFKHKLKSRAHPFVKNIPDYIPKIKLISEEDKSIDRTLSLKNIFFAFSWILFGLLLIQLPKWHNRQMTSFEPFDVLEIPKGSSESQIKRAYRKMSLKYHPDKCTKDPLNLPEAKCKDMFIMVRKAYESLTDEQTKDNYEKYGNPDGYQGTSVTIGLPSWLTHKDNELLILSVYFFALIIMVGVVYTWWNYSNKFHKSGVYKRSIDIYWRFIKQDMRLRQLLDILAASAEYRMLDVSIPNDPSNEKYKEYQALEHEILSIAISRGGADPNRQTLDNLFEASYARKAAALLHAHLMGMQIPKDLYAEYMLVLQEAPRLLDVMIDMTVSRERFWAQTMQLIQLKQAIIQGVWPMESHLKQLPHWTPNVDKAIRKRGYNSILALSFLDDEKLSELLNEVYSKYSEDHSHLISPLKEDTSKNNDAALGNESGEVVGSANKKKSKKKYGNKGGKRGNKRHGKGGKASTKKKKQTSSAGSPSKDKSETETQEASTDKDNENEKEKETADADQEGSVEQTDDTENENDNENDNDNENENDDQDAEEDEDDDGGEGGDDDGDGEADGNTESPSKPRPPSIKDLDDIPPGSISCDPSEIAAMAHDALACIRMYPFVKMEWCARTYEETEIFNEDIVKVTVHLNRERDPWKHDISAYVFVERIEPPEFSRQVQLGADGEKVVTGSTKNDYDDEEGLNFVDNELEDARRLQIARLNAPVVHVNEGKFPFRVREKWLVMLVDLQNNIVIDQRAVPDLSGLRKVDLHFRAQKPRTGKYPYRLVVKCDSYLGADKAVTFEVFINCDNDKRSKRGGADKRSSESTSSSEQPDYQIPDDDEDAHDPKWYYLWNENFWEFLLTLFLLYFIYLVIVSSSWGKRYIQPYMDIFSERVVYPFYNLCAKNMNEFVVNPISKQLLKETGFDLIKWWYQIEDAPDHDNTGIDEDDILSEEDEAYFKYAEEQFSGQDE
eukprot:CAMPEP_0197021852 /NCGR_PEP_ID=MMETSP1384-20130603/2738_1 /TAXON_ID=29189 /ORGANISM="Ammonia sp." /LENGTH=988 /DNA_ID=CAMNT_0042449767 /DNA_START=51 /DNA_END=3017 /DNA_ORIENTATION=+